ncbi:MAG: hypothetical protein Q9213_008240 [Squamulea squamosa]
MRSERPLPGSLSGMWIQSKPPYDTQPPFWEFLFHPSLSDDDTTRIVLLLFENGSEINQIVQHWLRSKTAFMWYLDGLKGPENALEIAAHFLRIAASEGCLPGQRYYLTGRISDVSSNDETERLTLPTSTTVLHDAVRAENYPLVEYLVKTRFHVGAQDSEGKLALDLATRERRLSSAATNVNSIIALLRQDVSVRHHGKRITAATPPLGWEQLDYGFPLWPNSASAWRETSIDGDFDAVSFIAPRAGLYGSGNLTLGRIQGDNQVYRLDPFRFLKPRGDVLSKVKPLTKASFDHSWYEEDARNVAERLPFYPAKHVRPWIRYPAISLQNLRLFGDRWSLVYMDFVLLSLLARLCGWRRLEIPFSGLAIGLYAFTTLSPKPSVTLNVLKVQVSRSNSEFVNVLWSNTSELLMGVSAVARGQTTFIKSAIIGFQKRTLPKPHNYPYYD